jgi:polyisoprenoid-binding protein YceI
MNESESAPRRHVRRITSLIVLFWTGFMLVGTDAQAQVYQHDKGHVEFLSNVPLHSFIGESELLVGQVNLSQNTVDFYVDLNTLDTGNGKRDKDMRKTLETGKYPFAEFFGSFEALPDSTSNSPQDMVVEGKFTIHGVTQSIRVPGVVTFSPTGLRVQASWSLMLDDYQIEPPRLLLLKVDEEQVITIDILLKSP